MPVSALVIEPDGTIRDVTLDDNDERSTLRGLQQAVGGMVDLVGLHGFDVWVHDEGLYEHAESPNRLVTSIVFTERLVHQGPEVARYTTMLYGPAVLACSDEHGNTVSLKPEIAERIREISA